MGRKVELVFKKRCNFLNMSLKKKYGTLKFLSSVII